MGKNVLEAKGFLAVFTIFVEFVAGFK